MPRLRTVRTKEEAEAVPEDQAISVVIEDEPERPPAETEAKPDGQQEEKTAAQPEKSEQRQEPDVQEEVKDESETLKQQLEELRQAEKAAQDLAAARQRELDDIRRRSQQQQGELSRAQADAAQAQFDMVLNALAAAQAESDAAQRDWEAAAAEGDLKRQSEANVRINRAQARIVQFEDAKSALEVQQQQKQKEQPQAEQPQGDPIEQAISKLPSMAQQWLRSHPEYLTNQRKNAQIQFLHHEAMAKGHEAFGRPYFDWIETELGMRKAPAKAEETEEEPQKGRVVVSAPVSREAPSLRDGRPVTTRITLSPEQRAAAKMSGISEVEYAKQLLRLEQAKKEGLLQ